MPAGGESGFLDTAVPDQIAHVLADGPILTYMQGSTKWTHWIFKKYVKQLGALEELEGREQRMDLIKTHSYIIFQTEIKIIFKNVLIGIFLPK